MDAVNEEKSGPASTGPSPGRQVATLLFCDLSNSVQLASTLEAEDYVAVIQSVRAAVEEAVALTGGEIGQYYGDGALVLFREAGTGAEAAVTAALAAAMRVRDRVRSLATVGGQRLSVHSGVHSGIVLLRDGDASRGRFEAVGLATAIAARLASAAGPDEILVSDPTLGPARARYRTGTARMIPIDRAGTSVVAVPVEGSAAPVLEPGGRSAFVGRQAERVSIEALLALAEAGGGGALLFEGPPGQGKTRLAGAASELAASQGFLTLAGASDPAGEALQPFRQMVRALVAAETLPDGMEASAIERALADPALRPLVAEGPVDPLALAVAVAAAIRRLAAVRPLLLLLDDWQWADTASQQLLQALAAAGGRVAILLLSRPHDAGALPPGYADIRGLPPLDDVEAVELVQSRVPALDWVAALRVARAAGGNPLFIEELCHLVGAGMGALPDVSRAGWFAASIEARFRQLDAALARLVAVAAVFGPTAPQDLLSLIAGVPLTAERLSELARRDLLFTDGQQLRFKHGLAQEILYQLLPADERRSLHAAIADALVAAGNAAPEALARHYAESAQSALAAAQAEEAGHRATAAAAVDRAQLHYRMALDALDRLPPSPETMLRWAQIVRRFAMIAIYDPDISHIALFEEAARRAEVFGDPGAIAMAGYWVGYARTCTGDMKGGLAAYGRALEAAERLPGGPLAGEIRAAMGHALQASTRYEEALPLLDVGTALTYRDGRRSISACVSLTYKAVIHADRGHFADAEAMLEEALAWAGGALHQVQATILAWQGAVRLWQGRPEDAATSAESARRVTVETGNGFVNAFARGIGARAVLMPGASKAEEARLEAAAACLWARRSLLSSSLLFGWCADQAARRGDPRAARAAAAMALLRARAEDLYGAPDAWRALARLAPSPERAARCLHRADAAADKRGSPFERALTAASRAERALADGRRDAAREALDAAEDGFARLAMPWHAQRAAALRTQL